MAAGETTIRVVTSGETNTLLGLVEAHYRAQLARDPTFALAPDWREQWLRALTMGLVSSQHRFTMAWQKAGAVGFCASWWREPPLLGGPVVGGIADLYVIEGARRRSVGRTLVRDALAWLGACKARRVELTTPVVNQAHAFWKALGFETCAHVMRYEPPLQT